MLKRVALFSVLCVALPNVFAEDITLTTYYPSPRGVYKELRAGSIEANNGAPYKFDLDQGIVSAKELNLEERVVTDEVVLIDDETGAEFGLRVSDRKMFVIDYASKKKFILFEFPEEDISASVNQKKRPRR